MRPDDVLVVDMLRFAPQAARAAADVPLNQLEDDPDRQSMVLWPLTLLGEAAAKVSDSYRATTPQIEWRRLVGLRNILIHDYSGIDMIAVEQVLRVHLPALINDLEALRDDRADE